jgi:hypothetical protein
MQRASWPAQVARQADVPFTLPLIAMPGCDAPLIAPLALLQRVGRPATDETPVCAPLLGDVSLPASDLAIAGATTYDALRMTPESAAAYDAHFLGELYRRVLPPGHTQVTAAVSRQPSFVSVELGSNEILSVGTSGIFAPGSSPIAFATWREQYDSVIARVRATGAHAVLVGLPDDVTRFPSVRRGWELAAQRAAFLSLNVDVAANCDGSENLIFVPRKVAAAAIEGQALRPLGRRASLSCADTAGRDFVLSPGDAAQLQAQVAQMNAHIRAVAAATGYACFKLEALYGVARVEPFDLLGALVSETPFGALVSLDGVHPSAAGHTMLAVAAIRAINQAYALDIPEPEPPAALAPGAFCG